MTDRSENNAGSGDSKKGSQSVTVFPQTWTARVLPAPPLIAPARQFVYPVRVPGEEEAMSRGALLIEVKPQTGRPPGGTFLATCALGFNDPAVPTGVFACPRAADMLALAGGYGYLVDTLRPELCLHLPLRPIVQLLAAPASGLLLLAGFHSVAAIGEQGLLWQTARLSWEGVTLQGVRDGQLHGTGWNMHTDREMPFTVNLDRGTHEGGGF